MFLVSVSIGPVQDFIAAARRTQDLASGSQLLGRIAGAAAATFDQPPKGGAFDPGLIFPTAPGEGGANKILALVESDPAAMVEAARQAAIDELWKAWETYRDGRSIQDSPHVDLERAETQIKGFLEIYGAWVPTTKDSYPEDRKAVEALLAGRKNLREFAPAPMDDAGVPKSPLDPSRASVVNKKGGLSAPASLQVEPLWLKGSEVLDGVSLFKRLYGRDLTRLVPSTRDLAQLGWDLDFKPRGEARALEEDENPPDFSYYAILVADGDHMGEHIGTIDTPLGHREFSVKLDMFAAEAAELVELLYSGYPVYTGGDDVMALLPVSTALECACDLASLFAKTMSAGEDHSASISAGLAIVHYREPLSVGLDRARRAESTAKEAGRSRLTLVLDKRSGQPLEVTEKWPCEGEQLRLAAWAEAFGSDELAGRLPYRLRILAEEWPPDAPPEALKAETLRIVDRSTARGGASARDILGTFALEGLEDLQSLVNGLVAARFLGSVTA